MNTIVEEVFTDWLKQRELLGIPGLNPGVTRFYTPSGIEQNKNTRAQYEL